VKLAEMNLSGKRQIARHFAMRQNILAQVVVFRE
jgi:hypothetical protein